MCNPRSWTFGALVALASGVASGASLPSAATQWSGGSEIYTLAEVEKGQRGFGLSVFSGSQVERFEFEVLGVWRNLQPRTSYVLARLEGQGLEESGVIAGMSGSPVYLDGRLLGAVSFGWPFANEAIAGITPVEHMRSMLARPGGSQEASGAASIPTSRLLGGDLGAEDLRQTLTLLRPPTIGQAPVAIEWATAGFGGEVRSLLGEVLGPSVVAGGAAALQPGAESADARLEPGAAVAAVLVDGDLRLAATGTVTDRVGDAILAFGHPFLGFGPVSVPMASAEVLTVVSSQLNSFKVANLGSVVGAVDFDFLTGIRGTLGAVAPVVPMVVELGDSEPVRVSLAKVPRLLPTLAAISVVGALGAEVGSAGAESIDLELELDLGAEGRLSMTQSFDGSGAPLAAALHVFAVTGYLVQTRLGEVDLRAIKVRLAAGAEPRTMTLVGAHPSRSVVRPGDVIRLHVDLAAYRGGRERRELEVEVPSNLGAGRYILLVGDGYSVDAVRLGLEQAEPETLPQALALLESLHSRRELRVLGVVEGPGLSVSGEVLPDLPGSVRLLWAASGGGGAKQLRMAIAEEAGLVLDRPVQGLLRLDLEVKRGQPVPGNGEAGGDEAETPGSSDAAPDEAGQGGGDQDSKSEQAGRLASRPWNFRESDHE